VSALSKSFGSSEASTSRAIATKRLCLSLSESFGKRFALVFRAMPRNVSSSKGNTSWLESRSWRFPRHTRGRLGRVRCPLATSCFVGKAFAARHLDHNRGTLHIVVTEFHAVAVAEIEFGKIPLQMGF